MSLGTTDSGDTIIRNTLNKGIESVTKGVKNLLGGKKKEKETTNKVFQRNLSELVTHREDKKIDHDEMMKKLKEYTKEGYINKLNSKIGLTNGIKNEMNKYFVYKDKSEKIINEFNEFIKIINDLRIGTEGMKNGIIFEITGHLENAKVLIDEEKLEEIENEILHYAQTEVDTSKEIASKNVKYNKLYEKLVEAEEYWLNVLENTNFNTKMFEHQAEMAKIINDFKEFNVAYLSESKLVRRTSKVIEDAISVKSYSGELSQVSGESEEIGILGNISEHGGYGTPYGASASARWSVRESDHNESENEGSVQESDHNESENEGSDNEQQSEHGGHETGDSSHQSNINVPMRDEHGNTHFYDEHGNHHIYDIYGNHHIYYTNGDYHVYNA
uniref:Uncharacterized protein n=1 Tax=Meloidogyne javanica TaxID=6303 RepID=A0A915LSM6_MELJA